MRIYAFLVVTLLSFSSLAETKVNLFDVDVLVHEQEENAKYSDEELARRNGMREVIVKTTGDSESLNHPAVEKAIDQSSRFLSSISSSERDGQPIFNMSFNSRQIQALLQQADIPYWPEKRANLLVWLVEDNGYDRTISWEQSGRESTSNLSQSARQKGLPITVPVGDIDDVTGIQATEVWGGFTEQIAKSSQRYNSDAVVVARLDRSGSEQNLRWTLYDDKPKYMSNPSLATVTGQASGSSQQVMDALVTELSHYYAQKSAVRGSGEVSSSISVNFAGIESAKDFFAVEKMLRDLSSVASVELEKVKGSAVDYHVSLLTDEEAFQNELLHSNKVTQSAPEPEVLPVLIPEETTEPMTPDTDAVSQPEIEEMPKEKKKLSFEWN